MEFDEVSQSTHRRSHFFIYVCHFVQAGRILSSFVLMLLRKWGYFVYSRLQDSQSLVVEWRVLEPDKS